MEYVVPGPERRFTTSYLTVPVPVTVTAEEELEAQELERRCMTGLDDAGATSWIFGELSTACPSDFEFTILNTTHVEAVVWIELFFEDSTQRVRMIKATVKPCRIRRLNIVDEADVDGDAVWFKWLTLKAQGVPENAPFAVRFRCDMPIVVSHATHKEIYRSSVNR